MSKGKFFGIGAGGNKAAINLVEMGVVSRDNIMLINSTLKDIPEEYRDTAIRIGESLGGCGKERALAKDLIYAALEAESVPAETLLDPDDDFVGIIASSEGGTGSGASIVLGQYFADVVGIPVHLFVFTGFEEDGRGLQNTVEYFSDIAKYNDEKQKAKRNGESTNPSPFIDNGFIVEAISNKKFLEKAGNKPKAEAMANDELARRVTLLLGKNLEDSAQNIDDTDLYKVINTTGFTTVEYTTLDKIKSLDQFDKAVTNMLISSSSLEFAPTATHIAVIMNIKDSTKDFVDYQFEVIKKYLGNPFEMFTHIQYAGEPEYIAVISSGMKMPLDEVKAMYDRYEQAMAKVDTSEDDFFSTIGGLGSLMSNKFNTGGKTGGKEITSKSKKDFFNKRNTQPDNKAGGIARGFNNTVKAVITESENPKPGEY